MATVSKTDLVKHVATEAQITRAHAENAVEALISAIASRAKLGDKVVVAGLGTFVLKHKPGRTARNPQTGLPVEVPARDVLTFKPAKAKA